MSAFYSFLPYLRQGLAANLDNPDQVPVPSVERAKFELSIQLDSVTVDGVANPPDFLLKEVSLKGPGDVAGINSNAIVKVSPADWVTNFEPNYLPYVEFFDEDFCWRYTPARYKKEGSTYELKYRLRPWLALVVLKEDEFQQFTAVNGKNAIKTLKDPALIFPPQEELWAWAHVHVNDNLGTSDSPIGNLPNPIQAAVNKLKTQILDKAPERAVSRIISPRRLEPNTGYTAFLIPTFETGRRSGLGLQPFEAPVPDMLDGAWAANTPSGTEYPVYHQWYFKTGGAGDFESLVRLLQPRILDAEVGKRAMDLQKSNNPDLEAVTPPTPTIDLQGVVQPINAVGGDWDTSDSNDYAKTIRQIINEPTKILAETQLADPIIAPPIYGRWHAAKDEVAQVTSGSPDWLQEVNLDPRFRIFAGAGTEVIRRNQEKYMDIAWSQIGEVLDANRKMRQLQLSKQANLALYNKHLKTLNEELLVNISAPLHQRIRNGVQSATVYKDIDDSILPPTIFSGAFRRLTRPGGPLVANIEMSTNTTVTTTDLIDGINSGAVMPAQPYQAPQGQVNYNIWGPSQLTPGFTNSLPSNSGFQFANPGVVTSTPAPGPNTPATQVMVNAIAALHGIMQASPIYSFPINPALDMNGTWNVLLERTEPYANALAMAKNFIKLKNVADIEIVVPDTNFIMAAPKIKIPMYEELAALSPDWIMPGLNDIAMNSINILETNPKYIEAFMLGLNYEMGRELLWRGYPTDQRGTCFPYFWGYNDSVTSLVAVDNKQQIFDLTNYRDIEDIHRWRTVPGNPLSSLTALGANNKRTAGPALLILTVRGELLRKYPGTIIYLQKAAEWVSATEPRKLVANTELYPVFTGKVEPDIYFLGFAITAEAARGGGLANPSDPGYFVVFQERAGEIRFGADEASVPKPSPSNITKWDDLSWAEIKAVPDQDGFVEMARELTVSNNIDSVVWNWNAGTVAYALYQSPVKLNVHAEGLIPEIN